MKIFTTILLFFTCFHVFSQTNFKSTNDSLVVRKLELEINKLEYDSLYDKYAKPFTIIGSAFGLVAILWTIFQGVKNIQIQTEQNKQNRISQLLSNINDEKPEKRASSANGLSRYPLEVYPEILSALKIETVEYVREALEKILLKLPDKEFEEVLNANRETIYNRTRLLGSFGKTELKIETTEALLGINSDTRTIIISNYKYFFDHGKETARYKIFIASELGNVSPDIKEALIAEAIQSARLAHSTSKVISQKLSVSTYRFNLSGLDLNLANLYDLVLKNSNFSKSIATNSICRHSDFSNSNFSESNFSSSDMFGCKLNQSVFNGSYFLNTSLRQCELTKTNLSNCNFFESILSQSDLKNSVVNKVDFRKSRIKGASFKDSEITDSIFNEAHLETTNFSNSKIIGSKFFGSNMKMVDFSNSVIENVQFNGANLQYAKFNNCKLVNVDFSGADLKEVMNNNWSLVNCKFHKAKNYLRSNLENEENNEA